MQSWCPAIALLVVADNDLPSEFTLTRRLKSLATISSLGIVFAIGCHPRDKIPLAIDIVEQTSRQLVAG